MGNIKYELAQRVSIFWNCNLQDIENIENTGRSEIKFFQLSKNPVDVKNNFLLDQIFSIRKFFTNQIPLMSNCRF